MNNIQLKDLLNLLEDGERVALSCNGVICDFEKEEALKLFGKSTLYVESFRYSTVYSCILIEC